MKAFTACAKILNETISAQTNADADDCENFQF